MKSVDAHSPGDKLNRKRYAIEPATNFRNGRSILVGQLELISTHGRPLDEQVGGWKCKKLRRG
jgi:hypothetical protein